MTEEGTFEGTPADLPAPPNAPKPRPTLATRKTEISFEVAAQAIGICLRQRKLRTAAAPHLGEVCLHAANMKAFHAFQSWLVMLENMIRGEFGMAEQYKLSADGCAEDSLNFHAAAEHLQEVATEAPPPKVAQA